MDNKDSQIQFFDTLKKSFLSEFLLSHANINNHFLIDGSTGSYFTLHILSVIKYLLNPIIFVFHDKEEALYALNECEDYLGKEGVLFFPSTYNQPYEFNEKYNANAVLRTEVLNKLHKISSYSQDFQKSNSLIIITYAKALTHKVISHDNLKKTILTLTVKEKIDIQFITELLFSYQFKHADFVSEPGEFSVRGGIVDIFSFSDEFPIRISFFGNEIETIRKFNIETQLSIQNIQSFSLLPNIDNMLDAYEKISWFDYLPQNSIFILKDFNLTLDSIHVYFEKAQNIFSEINKNVSTQTPHDLFISKETIFNSLKQFITYELGNTPEFEINKKITLNLTPPPFYQKNFELFNQELQSKKDENYKIYINFNSKKQAERLQSIFYDINFNNREESTPIFTPLFLNINKGFIDHSNKIGVFTDHQIFERYHAFKARNSFAKSETLTLKALTDYKIGDYITHIDHGIGKFMGLQRINNSGKVQEAIKIVYLNNDILYVNIHALHKISRFNGKEGKDIQLNKLGSPTWKILKTKTKKRVKEVAFDLIQLYAQRKTQKGFAFSQDGYLQNELEASFMYEDTPDQEQATLDVKNDMEKPTAMDRLICGDVGFGKTEIAIRAAFKTAVDGKQVAILVPTTILAFQHFNTFKKRLNEFPITVEYINRFRSAKTVNEVKEKLIKGKIDILIGTHQLVGKDIKFKDLGLLIVDEEHKFGVAVKDKLKNIKTTVDTLTLTATPIPRTLQFSLMSARDMSVIKTPPPNRRPVNTELIEFNEKQIQEAILYELNREGQVFFLNNRIENLPDLAGMLQRLAPEARIAIGHGQMDGKKMEDTLISFMKGEKDVLLSTTIIESGLDVPNANTIFINNAHQFGLADLHQIRGRVGRSDRKAFCYLLAPPFSTLTSEAKKRLEAITQFSDLGSGFYIAMKDLEIRGAGDLLGGEQSGFINDIGFETYQKILQEAIEELKNNEFSDLFEMDNINSATISDVAIDTDLEILFPDTYINNVEERFALYQKLSNISNKAELQQFEIELEDRFGNLPVETSNLLKSIELKWIAKGLGFEKITLKNDVLLCYFIQDEKANYYQTPMFQSIIQFLQNNPKEANVKQKLTKESNTLYLRKNKVKTIEQAKVFLEKMGA